MDKDYKIYIFKMIKEIKDRNKNMRKGHKLLKWRTKDQRILCPCKGVLTIIHYIKYVCYNKIHNFQSDGEITEKK